MSCLKIVSRIVSQTLKQLLTPTYTCLLQTELQSDKYKNKAEISALEAEVESLNLHLQQEQQAASKLQVHPVLREKVGTWEGVWVGEDL